jgi:hypothetical protein
VDEIKPEKNNIILVAIRWVFGILFLMAGFGDILKLSLIAGLIYLLAGIISIPPTASALETKLNFKISGAARFIVVFVLLMAGSAASPHIITSAAVNNSTNAIAAPPSSISGSEAIAVPSEPTNVATPTLTQIPEIKESSASIPKVTETPEVTPTREQISTPTPTTREINTGGTVYASSESNKYHSAGCRYVSKIKPEHLITFNSRQEAEAAGYSACKVCGG